jgi:Ca-activated chloride channel homolog
LARKQATMFDGLGLWPSHERDSGLVRQAVPLILLVLAPLAISQDGPTFTAEADLQSIAVEVTDHHDRAIRGLTAADFTLLEDGRPQKISFFGAEEQPISLAVLIDSSSSMRLGNKLERVREILPPLMRGNLPGDEIYFAQFTDHVFPVQLLTGEERLHPPIREVESRGGTAFYDAVATTLCTMHRARNQRQAVVVITDGADQHSRLSLNELIRAAQASRPQIFMIGIFDDREANIFRSSGKVVTLVNSNDIDNPFKAFDRISKETGGEAFFPANERDLGRALTRILGILRAQYTLAYHTAHPNTFRRIQVKVNRSGATVSARRAVGAEAGDGKTVHLSPTICEISASEHPFGWEPRVTKTPDGQTTYRDDFSNPRSGWPIHEGLRYAANAYELSVPPPARSVISAGRGMTARVEERIGSGDAGEIAAYGPWFTDFRASVKIEPRGDGDGGLIFRANDRGYYLLLIQKGQGLYKLVRKFWDRPAEESIVPWTPYRPNLGEMPGGANPWITAAVECVGERIKVTIDGIPADGVTDGTFADGQIGMAFFGGGRALFRNLQVDGRSELQ